MGSGSWGVGDEERFTPIAINHKPVLQPGPNLLAISVHTTASSNDDLGLRVSLEGEVGLPDIGYVRQTELRQTELTNNSFTLRWVSKATGNALLKYGTLADDLSETVMLPDSDHDHTVRLENLIPETTYYYEVILPNGASANPPIIGSFRTLITTIVDRGSGDWAYYQSIDDKGDGFDPVVLDPDFDSTWFDQSMGNYQGGAGYDGPAFVTGSQSPFYLGYVAGATNMPNNTELRTPNSNSGETAWFLKVVDGGTTGFSKLAIKVMADDGAFVYLNGKRIGTNGGLIGTWSFSQQADDRWSLRANRPGYEFSLLPINQVGEPVLLPGPNLIAVSVHDVFEVSRGSDGIDLGFNFLMTGSVGLPPVAQQQGSIATDTEYEIVWISREPGNSVVRYGLDPVMLDQIVNVPSDSLEHEVILSGLTPFTDYHYEILTGDGEAYDPPVIGQFETERTFLIHPHSTEWSFVIPQDEVNGAINPESVDPDFYQTWLDHEVGGYRGSGEYDGPDFSPAPKFPVFMTQMEDFGLRQVPETHNLLFYENSESKEQIIWFVHEVDGGLTGMKDLQIDLGVFGGAFVYLNGALIGTDGIDYNQMDRWSFEEEFFVGNRNFDRRSLTILGSPSLVPGSNLIAVAVHNVNPGSISALDFSMHGVPGLPDVPSPETKLISDRSASIYWVTPEAGPAFVRFGLQPGNLDLTGSVLENSFSHSVSLENLRSGNEYFYEILTADQESYNPPLIGSFVTERSSLTEFGSSDWAYFQSIDETQIAIDPALADQDFHQTWFNQSFGGYEKGTKYDGPSFITGGKAPFGYGRFFEWSFAPNTVLPFPEGESGRVIWFLKEIDGGEFGFSELQLDAIVEAGAIVYLNGERIAYIGMGEGAEPEDNWDFALRGARRTEKDVPLLNEVILNPGSNLLAISLRPDYVSGKVSFDLSMSGKTGLPPFRNVKIEGIGAYSAVFRWQTRAPSASIVYYGTSADQLNQVQRLEGAAENHEISFTDLKSSTQYYYRIISVEPDGSVWHVEGRFNTRGVARGPYLQKVSHNSATIRWRSGRESRGVYYGPSFDQLEFASEPSTAPFDHTVVLEGLQPDTVYYYEVPGNFPEDTSPPYVTHPGSWFRTAPLPGTRKKTRIWAIGDAGTKDLNSRKVYEAYQQYHGSPRADVWLMLGDNAYIYGTDSEYGAAVFGMYPEMLRTTPVWPTMGNHDGYSASTYYDIFDLPTNAEAGGIPSGTESYYSFDHGNIHFVCLNSEEHSDGTGGMAEWLRLDLEATAAEWIIAFFHHGPYTKGSHDSDTEIKHGEIRENFLGILEECGVDLILSGHSHGYERSKLIDGHYGKSSTYSDEEHAIDSGNGSDIGSVLNNARFVTSGGNGAYEKALVASHGGQVSIIAGASGKVTGSSFGGYEGFPVFNPSPHPVMVNSMRILGSLVIDVDGLRLDARYLDYAGNVRDHFAIQKGSVLRVLSDKEEASETGSRFTIHREGVSREALTFDYTLSGSATALSGAPVTPSGSITFAPGEISKVVELITPTDGLDPEDRVLALTLEQRLDKVTPGSVARPTYLIAESASDELALQNSPIQEWWLAAYGPTFLPDWTRDDDGDGHSSLVEYAYGGSASARETMSLFQTQAPHVSNTVELHYSRDNGLTGFRFVPMVSEDLIHFEESDILDTTAGPVGPDGLDRRKVTLPAFGLSG